MKNLNKSVKIYVDCDGVLVCGSHDDVFVSKCKNEEFNNVLNWYNSTYVDDLNLNMELINQLIELKELGYELILWTNRGDKQYEMTKKNLGIYWNIFNDHMFLSGGKRDLEYVDGFIIEDTEKNAVKALHGYLIINYRPYINKAA